MKNQELTDTPLAEDLPETALPALAPGEVLLGTLVAIDAQGQPLVNYPQGFDNTGFNKNPVPAISTLAVTAAQIGRQVALLFARGDYQKPIIVGFIYSPLYQLLDSFSHSDHALAADEDIEIFPLGERDPEPKAQLFSAADTLRVDGKKVVIEGEEEVVLTCGESSITLTKAGKIIIRGKYLVSRASGVNRILGGSVQVN